MEVSLRGIRYLDLKVLFITTEYPPYVFGGGGIFAYSLTHSLASMGVNVTVIAASTDMSTKSFDYRGKNIKVYRVGIPRIPPQHVWFQLIGLHRIISVIDKVKPDIIHANSFSAAIIFKYLKETGLKYPLLVTLHGYPRHYLRLSLSSMKFSLNPGQIMVYTIGYPIWDLLLSTEIKYSDIIVTMSKYIARSIITDYDVEPDKVTYIPNGVDLSIINDIQCIGYKKYGNSEKPYYIVLAGGRLFYEKGLFLIPYVARELKKYNYSNVLLLIFGEGPYKNLIKRLIKELNVNDRVVLLGKIPHRHVLELLCIADVVLIPSIYELMPMFLLEAIAMKKPVIALRSHYIDDFKSKGIVIEEAKNISDMAMKIIHMINNISEWRKIAQKNYSILVKEFDISVIARKYVDVYKSIIGFTNA